MMNSRFGEKSYLMNSRRACFLALFFICVAAALFGFGKKEKDDQKDVVLFAFTESTNEGGLAAQEPGIVQITGVVRLVGSALFPEIIIAASGAEWYAAEAEAAKLHDLQHRTVTVEGLETVKELEFANGRPAGRRRELRDIKIIAIE